MAVIQSVDADGPWVRIRLAGEIDVADTDLIKSTVDDVLTAHPDATVLEIDLADVTLIDSTGVGLLTGTVKALGTRGVGLIVTNPARIVERVMRVTGVFETLTGTGITTGRRNPR